MIRSPALLLAALLVLAACGKSEAPTAPTGAAAAPAAAASAARTGPASVDAATAGLNEAEPPLPELGDFKVVSLLMGNSVDDGHVVIADTRSFAAKDAIYASVLSIGAHQGLKLSANWIAPDGSSIAKSEQAIVPDADLATTFKLQNPAGWPVGDYQLRIAIDGHTIRSEAFTVQ